MKIYTLLIALFLSTNCLIAQQLIGVAANHKLVTSAVRTSSSSVCPSGEESTPAVNEIYERELIELINIERDNQGLAPLKYEASLTSSSRYHASDMAANDYFTHNSMSGCTTFDRISAFYSYISAGENIASGYPDPETVHLGFVNSPPHYTTMTNSSYREVGVGYSYDNQAGSRWVENFGSRVGVYPIVINLEAILTEQMQVNIYAYGKEDYDEIRFKNDGENWSDWMIFDVSEFVWTISGDAGTNAVIAEMRNSGSTKTSQDEIEYEGNPTGIELNTPVQTQIEMYPNPVIDALKLYNIGTYTTYRVYNMQGQQLSVGQLNNTDNVIVEINVARLPQGNYILMLQNEQSAVHERFIKL